MALKPFVEMVRDYRQEKYLPIAKPTDRIVCLDPGETTGCAIFDGLELRHSGQLNTKEFPGCVLQIRKLFVQAMQPNGFNVVMEDYKVYSWKSQSHSWSGVHTLRLIGAIQAVLILEDWLCTPEIIWQSAQQGKAFCTDPKLLAWGFYKEGERHARDAIRHGCNYLLFNDPKAKPKS